MRQEPARSHLVLAERVPDAVPDRPAAPTAPVAPVAPHPPGPLPLLTAKLTIPPLPDGTLIRPRLHERLDAGARGAVTLLAAPAGWGKTVLLTGWAAGQPAGPDAAAPGEPPTPRAAWLSAATGDDGRFWSYLRAALAATSPVPEPAPGPRPDPVFLTRLADALSRRAEPVVLVIDDYHQLRDPGIAAGLDFLLRHCGGGLRLVLASRVEPRLPLHRWRVSGQLAELGLADLAFTPEETAALARRHGLALSSAHLDRLHARTEGWPAGLRLAALSLGAQAEAPSGPGPSGADQGIADYLTGEVLAGYPEHVRDALLSTAILDRVSGDLLDALTGGVGGERLLADLARGNGFVIPVGAASAGRPASYRYHRMFADLLRAELRRRWPDRVAELHRRAAGWFAAHRLPGDALRHALSGGDHDLATSLLVAHWPALTSCAPAEPGPEPAPAPPVDAIRADPELALAYSVDRLNRRDPAAADALLRLAERHRHLLAPQRRDRYAVMVAGLHLAVARARGDAPAAAARAGELLGRSTGVPPDTRARALALAALGADRLGTGDLEAAQSALLDARRTAERSGPGCVRTAATARLAYLLAVRGALTAAERTARTALDAPPCPGRPRPMHGGYASVALALVALYRDRLDEAAAQLVAAADAGAAGEPGLAAAVGVVRALLHAERGDLTAAYAALRTAREAGPPPPYLAQWSAAVEADLRTARGDTGTVRAAVPPGAPLPQRMAVALARSYLRDGDPQAATRTVPAWSEENDLPLPVRIDAGLVDALAARAAGDRRRAARALERILSLAEPEGYRRPFTRPGTGVRELLVDHLDAGTAYWPLVSDLTAAAPPRSATSEPGTGTTAEPPTEPLTERELTVLRYLQSILSNVEIAAELCLSVNTVKTHVRNIYRKLDATRRRDAVRRARDLKLL
ncbi:LuxR C-terminal-related transcriptional regulator [Rhizomonospora bruguierae]|uniref:LuxR C-terminal-related transcriptional regulator n=1 Tax=Rhizomonospora bruguierae TaxID=1581705 RepID=UPI001BCEA530|nr:LuxR C-terminal-related transcriptional regulator [Micromonospora sp. NBRC 107566]